MGAGVGKAQPNNPTDVIKAKGTGFRFLKALGLSRLKPTESVLTVTIKEARNLLSSHNESINPYVVISFKDGSHRQESLARHHTSQPSWEQTFAFPLAKEMCRLEKNRKEEKLILFRGDIAVQCRSCSDTDKDHRILGALLLRLPDLALTLDGDEQEGWHPLGEQKGEVRLAVAWRSETVLDDGPPALLSVRVAAALFLPTTDPLTGFCDPFARVTFLPAGAGAGAGPRPAVILFYTCNRAQDAIETERWHACSQCLKCC